MVVIFARPQIITVDILYYRPDFRLLLQEFIWQTDEGLPRVQRFLKYWHENIDAIIAEVTYCEGITNDWKKLDHHDSLR